VKPFVKAALTAAVALLVACQPPAGAGNAALPGTHSLALVGDLLFVTATDGNELRVLSVSNEEEAQFVTAPNPLHPLSIPVADRPIALANDVVWRDGAKGGGRWVYSLSANGQEISIVGASRDSLVEEKRLELGKLVLPGASGELALPGPATITAIAARGQDAGSSTLYLGTFDGAKGQLFAVEVPEALEPTTALTASPVGVDVACGAVQSILVLPEANKLAYSSSCAAAGSASAFLVDLSISPPTSTPLRFAFPTRSLVTNPKVEGIEAGSFIYGVYDEQSCGGALTCRGISAVVGRPADMPPANPVACGNAVGDPACDFTGHRMPTIDVGDALVQGVEIAPNAGIPGLDTKLTGILTTSHGRIMFIDAERLAPRDLDDAAPTAGEVRVEGGQVPPGVAAGQTGITSVVPQTGAARTDTITVEFGANLPGLTRVPYTTTAVPNELGVPVNPANRVRVSDVVDYSGSAECDAFADATVTALPSAPGVHTITVSGAPPAGTSCLMTIRPGTDIDPWVVTGAAAGFMGRIARDGTPVDLSAPFEWPATDDRWSFEDPDPAYNFNLRLSAYYAHPEGFGADRTAAIPAAIRFSFVQPLGPTPATDPETLQGYRGLKYILPIDGHYNPAATRMSDRLSLFELDVAGSVSWRAESRRMYVAFPSGNTVVEVEAQNITLGGEITVAEPHGGG
jgi:hypothetical protein